MVKVNGNKNGKTENAEDDEGEMMKKRAKIHTTLQEEILASGILDREDEFRSNYASGKPYPYAHITELFQPEFLLKVKEEIKSQTKVNFKESDLFRVYQSIDMANLQPGSDLANQLPNVMKLREALYSQEWKSFMERVAGLPPSTLTNQIDCACNCHAPGCHLLCHDDVIGTRKISYIIYLTEPDWKPEEGGSLELYGPQTENDEASSPLPEARAWPFFNSMAFFEVQPGFSYHAVQEVLGDRPRLSLQGWYHASEPPKNIELATLQQLKALKKEKKHDGQEEGTQNEIDFPTTAKAEDDDEDKKETPSVLSKEDREYLAKYLQDEYLTEESIKEIQTKFGNDSSVQLRNFLQSKWVPRMEPAKPIKYDDAHYQSGVSVEWKLRGPAHKQRYLEFQPHADHDHSQMIGSLMHHVKTQVFESPAMGRYLHLITGLDSPTGVRNGQVRRFRPGLDYTVAHYGLLVDKSVLDATMCFVYDDNQEDKDAWESGDVGGFECYIEADDDFEEDKDGDGNIVVKKNDKGPADEYNEDDDTELLSVSACNNTLSLVYRDPGTMRFIKYVGSSAPSSRYDICMEYDVPESPAGDDDEEDEEENEKEE